MKDKTIKIVCIVAAGILLLGAVISVIIVKNRQDQPEILPTAAPTQEDYVYAESVTIYSYNEETDELSWEQESIQTNEIMSLSELIVRHIIYRQKELFAGAELINVAQSGDVVLVNFTSAFYKIEDTRRFRAIQVLAASLNNVDNIQYVCILVDGVAYRCNKGINVLFPTVVNGKISALYERYNAQTREGWKIAVFFPEVSHRYVIAETRNANTDDEDMLNAVLRLLGNGPYNSPLTVLAPKKVFGNIGVSHIEIEEGKCLILDFISDENMTALNNNYSLYSFVSAIVNTVQCNLDGIDRIRIRINGTYLELEAFGYGYINPNYERGQFMTDIGNTITLYYPTEQNVSKMVSIRRAVSGSGCNMMSRIRELFREPVESNKACQYCFADLSTRSIRSAVMYGNELVIDVSEEFVALLERMSEAETKSAVFGIVNTVCDVQRVRKVRFTINDEEIESIGKIDTSDWMYPIYGVTEE